METLLQIDDDVLTAAKALAIQQDRSLGEVISDLSRQALESDLTLSHRNGLPVFRPRADAAPVTLEIVNSLRDSDGWPTFSMGTCLSP